MLPTIIPTRMSIGSILLTLKVRHVQGGWHCSLLFEIVAPSYFPVQHSIDL